MALAHEANRYLNVKEPWKQIKTDPEAAATSVFVALRVIDTLKTLFAPFLPFTCQALHEYLGYDGELVRPRRTPRRCTRPSATHLALRYDAAAATAAAGPSATCSPGQALREPKPLFLKLEPTVAEEEVERMTSGA